jgi:hypothetical protein
MTMRSAGRAYDAASGMQVMGEGQSYELNNNSSWQSGAGTASYGLMRFGHIERSGMMLSYVMDPDLRLVERTDYDNGAHSANFELDSIGQLVLVALQGSTTGTLHGQARIVRDEPANYNDSRFNLLSAPVGSIVPFTITYTLGAQATFEETLFDSSFEFVGDVVVDFTHPVAG